MSVSNLKASTNEPEVSTSEPKASTSEPKASTNNFAFLYMPFVCRGKELGSYQEVQMPLKGNIKHWKLVTSKDADAQEEGYLYSYISGMQIGEEDPSEKGSSTDGKKYCHYIFTGNRAKNESIPSGRDRDSFLSILQEVVSKYPQNDNLFGLRRKIKPNGPICDGGSSHLAGKSLGQLFFGKKENANEHYVDSLKNCTCWRIRKAHRFPPLEECSPKDGKRFDESDQPRRYITFDIRRVHCYWFSTGIAILAFEISLHIPPSSELKPQNAPYWVSSALFHLKKVQSVRILPTTEDYASKSCPNKSGLAGPKGISFCNLGKLLVSDLLNIPTSGNKGDQGRPYLFYQIPASVYRGPKSPAQKSMRSNVFSYVALPNDQESLNTLKDKNHKPLYYLAHCFDVNVPYSSDSTLSMDVQGSASDIRWGITTENVSCLTLESDYIVDSYYDHVRYQFQFIYVLLLHQKYFYYFLLSQIVGARIGDLGAFVEHRNKLERFNAAFAFSRITEVVQYQQFYELAGKAMGLEQLKADVREPLEQLASQQQERESKKIDRLGVVLAILGSLSVVCDVYMFVNPNSEGKDGFLVMGVTLFIAIIAALLIVGWDRIRARF